MRIVQLSLSSLQKNRSLKDLTPGEQEQYKEFRRRSHISAEQKRRGNIKNGFDRLQSFVAHLSPPSSTKLSKASVLLKSKCGNHVMAHCSHVLVM